MRIFSPGSLEHSAREHSSPTMGPWSRARAVGAHLRSTIYDLRSTEIGFQREPFVSVSGSEVDFIFFLESVSAGRRFGFRSEPANSKAEKESGASHIDCCINVRSTLRECREMETCAQLLQ